jgi:hypothetical protein
LASRIEFDEAAVRQLRKMPVREATRIRDYLRDRIARLWLIRPKQENR